MAIPTRIERVDDPRIADYLHLRDVQLRKLLETERGLYIAEGEKVIRRALRAGHLPRSFILTERWLAVLSDVIAESAASCYVLNDALLEQATGYHVHRGALAAFERPQPRSVLDVITGAQRIVVIEDVMDHTNIGGIFRSATALGAEAIVLSPRCADPLYRRAIKVSMGAAFEVPWARFTDWAHALNQLHEVGFATVALTPDPAAVPLDAIPTSERMAIVVGAEGDGLSARWLEQAQSKAKIPMHAGIDSLNVATATALACWQLRPR